MSLSDPLSVLLITGLVLKSTGFVLRDELVLRIFVATGISMDIAFYALQPIPILQSVATNTVLVSVNVILIVTIFFERTTWRMSDEDKALFSFFPTLTPGQFRRVLRTATRYETSSRTQLIGEGAEVSSLFLVFAEAYEITKQGQTYIARGPAFVGEIGFLTGARASAAVEVAEGTRIVAFESAALKKVMGRKPAIHNGMVALFGEDLAAKVAASVPMEMPVAASKAAE